ncbi:cytochrome c oxidase subunit 3 (plasmid) [Deinococcus sp. KNUC1210]|uniref:cytochrome c oxidase subunit 3 n=1 Tax=Deinococcus sp. KNUC1210 TaxID=2917691 RepID=UPI001EEF8195|nr:cytochrome c oxidase subunit 3 [Deinococcus sp. KNUC1210]ULH13871.1 cytochrome c oxidase subunit 3 [Deinococcus sp. KNUC1210]
MQSDRASRTHLGMLAFLASDAVIFLLMLVSNIYLRRSEAHGGQSLLEPGRMLVFSVLLWGSSGVLLLAERQRGRGDRVGAGTLYLVTALLGAVFALAQGLEWRSLAAQGGTISSSLFFSTFYTTTGLHGLHVLLGLPVLLALALLSWTGQIGRRAPGVAAAVLYWHFVDAVWLVLYLVFYVWRGP